MRNVNLLDEVKESVNNELKGNKITFEYEINYSDKHLWAAYITKNLLCGVIILDDMNNISFFVENRGKFEGMKKEGFEKIHTRDTWMKIKNKDNFVKFLSGAKI